MLVQEGAVREEFLLASAKQRSARTAVGVREDGSVVFYTADSRDSTGMTLAELADKMLALGCRNALNLDGGGSTTVVVRNHAGEHEVRNIPSGPAFPFSGERYGYEKTEPVGAEQARGVSDAVLIIPKQENAAGRF